MARLKAVPLLQSTNFGLDVPTGLGFGLFRTQGSVRRGGLHPRLFSGVPSGNFLSSRRDHQNLQGGSFGFFSVLLLKKIEITRQPMAYR